MRRLLALLALLPVPLFACVTTPPPADPTEGVPATPEGAPTGEPSSAPVASTSAPATSSSAPTQPGGKASCSDSSPCAAGEQCQGPAGCGAPWTCGPARACTRDLVEFCGCDGTTFRGSSTCPARPYTRRGPC